MPNYCSMYDVELHFGQLKMQLDECASSVTEVSYPLESILISSHCNAGTFKV